MPLAATLLACRHCQRRLANRPRQLCWSCYYSPARDLYPADSMASDIRDFTGISPLPDSPTSARPGSAEKQAVLAARAAAGVALHHPQDAPRE